jgi:hypothetical protein
VISALKPDADTPIICHVIRVVALASILAMTAAAQRSAPRSERRGQARAQSGRTKASPRSSSARREFQRLHPCPSSGRRSVPIRVTWSITSFR